MVNKILIRKSDRKTLHKDRRSLGMNGENLQEVLLFCLDEKIEGNGIVEVELPNGEKGMIEVDRTEEGYELPVKSSLLTQTGFVKFQLRILHDNEEIFKSEIIPLEVKDSINATATIPEEYPSWVDTLTNLKKDLEKAESERVSNEEERQTAEEARQENFTEMQKTVKSAVSNIKDLKEDYNTNAKKKTDEFNNNFEEKQKAINDNAEAKTTAFGENAEAQTKTFNTNSDDKLAEYNRNHTAKMKEFDDNYDTKTKTFDDNAADKLDEYNKNTELKEKSFNDNAGTKTETFNSNAADKQNEFDENASDKLSEYNQNAKELINKVEQVQAENETLKAENKLIKEQIPSASASGNSIHVEDSGTLDFDWKINGNQYQATREGYNLLDFNVTQNSKVTVNEDGTITINGTGGFSIKFKEFEYKKGVTYKAKATLVSGTYTSSDPNHIGIMTPYGDNEWLANNIFKTYTFLEDKVRSGMWVGENCVFNNATFEIYSYEGTDDKNFEQYGVSPSLDYPSEIETVGSNANLCDNSRILVGIDPQNSSEKDFRTSDYIKVEYGKNYVASLYNEKKVRIGNLVYQTWNKNFEKLQQITTDTIKITNQDIAYVTVRNYKNDAEEIKNEFYYKFEESLIATPYSPYGMGSVEIDVVNKNLFDRNKSSDNFYYNLTGGTTIDGTNKFINQELPLSSSYTISYKNAINSTSLAYVRVVEYDKNNAFVKRTLLSNNNSTLNIDNKTNKVIACVDAGPNAYFEDLQIEKGTTSSDYIEHQSQTAIMPIQQEMLIGDYISSVEHHEWQKFIFDGVTNRLNQKTGTSANNLYYTSSISNLLAPTSNGVKIEICSNCFKSYTANQLYGQDLVGVAVTTGKSFSIGFGLESSIDTLDKANEKLKELYDAGTPIIIYYKLVEAVDLELTSEQKAVREQKLYTYKNITNISLSDELASVEVEYKKDQDTINKNYENRLAALEAASIS